MRILTYNTRGSLGMDGKRRTDRIAETVRAYAPDIVCFQEIHRRLPWSGREDQPAVLESLLHRPFYFQANVRFGFGDYGIGVATRDWVVSQTPHFLPSGKERRGAVEIQLRDIAGLRSLTVFCTHWGLDAEERKAQAQALAQLVKAAKAPVVLCGDLNEAPDGAAVRLLLEETGLQDADATPNRPTFPSNAPGSRIDYILHSPGLEATNVEVGTSLASDHLPLCADLFPRLK